MNGERPHGNERIPGIRSMPGTPIDVSIFFGPLRWLRWRREVRRLGPYASPYDGRTVLVQCNGLRIGFVVVEMVAFALIVHHA